MTTATETIVATSDRPARVGFLLISGFAMLAYVAAIESLRAANQIAKQTLYTWHHLRPDDDPAVASNDVAVACDCLAGGTEQFDLIFVCASDEAVSFDQGHALAWLRSQAARGAMIGGIGGGAFILARAGVLTNHRMTLHWAYAPAFAEEFPNADLRKSLYEIDGKRLTCGGGMSPLDMMHALFVRRHGMELADGVSDWFLHTDIRESWDSQRRSLEARLGVSHPGLIRALEAMENRIEDPLSRAELAGIAGLSERQLDRLFVAQLNSALTAYYLRLRLDRSRQLVRQTGLSQMEIAVASGFKSASRFSKAYRAMFGLPPSAERQEALRLRRHEKISGDAVA
ncbi:transcriptional regulator GlxA family with amidase domain [Sphingobium sp. JAI105]|uniref:GlxA family transcriptional regulator n=1 Tax=Sphingobium sp. JAI105 TaxID=2787715 RepID=UPI0018C8E9FB|nr:GlxA family transcriptional regulator [Sphingobium sp. JAI105]MBG6118470.1 transcriptional regulator GlxA family with amidase domain [Sphingobium sp. JAI105]